MSLSMNRLSTTSDQIHILVDQPILKPNPQPADPNATHTSFEEKRTNPVATRTLRRLNFSKPKSRFLEVYYPPQHIKTEDHPEPEPLPEPISSDEEDFDDDKVEEDYDAKSSVRTKQRRRNMYIRWRSLLDWVSFLTIMSALICSLTVESLKDRRKYGIELWKGCLMMMALISGRFIAGSIVSVLVFIIERNFVLREKVLYFVYGLRKSFQNQLWLGLVLLAWALMFRHDEAQKRNKMLENVFKALVSTLIGSTIWLVKILLVKILASAFHVTTFFDRMKESVFHHYILETLSGPPLDDEVEPDFSGQRNVGHSKSLPATLEKRFSMKRIGSSRKIDRDTLRKMSMESSDSAWGVKRLVNYVMSSGLSTISKTVDDFGKAESEICNEWEARTCAQRTFKNVAKPGAKCIEEEDLMQFLRREEIHTIFPFFEGALETGLIRRSSFRNWVVRAYRERKSLAHSLNDTKSAVQQLHRLASAMVVVIIVVIFLLVMGFATSKVVLLVTSQLLLVGFMFQNTCKTIFESVIFVFVMHPFDVGDRCVIDGAQMVVEEMNILTTVFLRDDNEKVFYPNSVLSTKPISNYYRSPEMGDGVEFTIDVSTSMEVINSLKWHIKTYIESKPTYWHPGHMVAVTEIENVDKMKMCLGVLHTMNHQNYGVKMERKSELLFELKRIFEKLKIKYTLLPQNVQIT